MSAITQRLGLAPEVRRELELRDRAMSGDLVLVCMPALTSRPATGQPWSRAVEVSLRTADGRVHDWCEASLTVAVADTSAGGSASTAASGLTLVAGRALLTVSGSAGPWLAGESNTVTVSGGVLGQTLTPATSLETIV